MADQNVNFFTELPQKQVAFEDVAIRLHACDNVGIARRPLQAGSMLAGTDFSLTLRDFVTDGHKFALTDVPSGAELRRYGQIIGFATQDIAAGEHVHTHNLAVQDFKREYEFALEATPVACVPPAQRLCFDGYRRAGRSGWYAQLHCRHLDCQLFGAHHARDCAPFHARTPG